ncbi:major facilitator superfamily protein, putative [Ichthyophthirius multifiliis]|uniref:Major facilitator superfamily protein, putative n=1 Tax=Ichthyophthirius multifiliis TaxID=5932 RepID=G0R1J3_ICHMU|nr:major facilitator superfamily protein, putative [Ichthyophthirius multifiliis]EGR28666.1 major facilitator superfamily protein, putative [Ichthyophthirius multifiliis]|eukprot:XP_004029902.1 major facilitator superfamily protein, putative [Ichthyophthirius multifiliis]
MFQNIKNLSIQAKKALIGVIIIKFATGFITTWGILNIYYYCYFKSVKKQKQNTYNQKQLNPDLKIKEISLLITITTIPVGIASLFSLRICRKYGYEPIIRISVIISSCSLIVSSYQDTFYKFALFYMIIPIFLIGSCVMPVLYCLWSHFPKNTGSATGIALASFGISGFLFLIITNKMVNPQNLKAEIDYQEGKQNYKLFGENVFKNIPQMVFNVGLIQLALNTFGCFFISYNKNQQDDLENNKQNIQQLIPNSIRSLKKDIFSQNFQLIYFSSFFINFIFIFLSLNFKIYGLTKINNDLFLTYLATIASVLGSLSTIFWGFIVDKFTFVYIYPNMILCLIFSICLFPLLSSFKFLFALDFIIFSLVEKGIYTIVAPGLVQLFGMSVGAELSVIKGTSFYAALFLVPIIQIWLLLHFNYDQCIFFIGLSLFISYFMSYYIR